LADLVQEVPVMMFVDALVGGVKSQCGDLCAQ